MEKKTEMNKVVRGGLELSCYCMCLIYKCLGMCLYFWKSSADLCSTNNGDGGYWG